MLGTHACHERFERRNVTDHATPDEPMTARCSLVSIVDDDESVRESLPDLLKELGFAVQPFSSARDFLASEYLGETDCLIVDVEMPGMTGPELQQELIQRGQKIPIIFITAYVDEAVRKSVIQHGAVDCLFKPFAEATLIAALNAALGAHAKA